MTSRELFQPPCPVMAMVHMKGDRDKSAFERAKEENEIYLNNGVEALLLENYFGSALDVERGLAYLQEFYPDAIYGVNVLGDESLSFELAERYGAKFIQIDSVCGHLTPEQDALFAEKLSALRKESKAVLLGGVRFKYQPVRSGRSLEEDLLLGMQRCDAIVVTGEGTGVETPMEKVKEFRSLVGDFPLVIGAGMTTAQLKEGVKNCDGFIVGSYFKEGHSAYGEVSPAYVREFIQNRQTLCRASKG